MTGRRWASGHNTGVPPNAREPDRLSSIVAGSGPRLVLLHGFTQTARCWGPFADALVAAGHEVVAVDAPGHGGSASVTTDFAASARLLGATGGRAVYVGYSMGGRIALRLALDQPELVRALVLIGSSPGLDDPDEREARREADDRLADRIEAIGVDAFLDEWLAQPLFAGLDEARSHRTERLRNTAAGLATSLRLAGTGAMEPLWSRLGTIRTPVLLLTGDRDTKFTELALRMVALMDPHAWHAAIADGGHSVHLEQPELTADVVTSWLRSHALA
jgi:2-succinyl-6-hydroxy-2,4-cyclohexadiene-1-carboxylate synthase